MNIGLDFSDAPEMKISPEQFAKELNRLTKADDKRRNNFFRKIVNKDMSIDWVCHLIEKYDSRAEKAYDTTYAILNLANLLRVDSTRKCDKSIDGVMCDYRLFFGMSEQYPNVSLSLYLPMHDTGSGIGGNDIIVVSLPLEKISKTEYWKKQGGRWVCPAEQMENMIGDENAQRVEEIEKRFNVTLSTTTGHGKTEWDGKVPISSLLRWSIRYTHHIDSYNHRENLEQTKDAVARINSAFAEYKGI